METNYALLERIERVKKSVRQISRERRNNAIETEDNGGGKYSFIEVEIKQHAPTTIFMVYPAVLREKNWSGYGVRFGLVLVYEQNQYRISKNVSIHSLPRSLSQKEFEAELSCHSILFPKSKQIAVRIITRPIRN